MMEVQDQYPQYKGKVERAIRNISEEFIYLLKKFPAMAKRGDTRVSGVV
ncbi:MAG: hypothetical protein SVY15_06155 [Halobacteriota archaeon]|nr:hypothetical protein [Halobacteriota archaeon]